MAVCTAAMLASITGFMRRFHEHRAMTVAHYLDALADEYGVSIELRGVWGEGGQPQAAIEHALTSDLIVTSEGGYFATGLSIGRLLGLGRIPLLIVPEHWVGLEMGKRVIVVWDDSQQARNALSVAMPLIMHAQCLRLLVVDPDMEPAHYGAESGAKMLQALGRHIEQVEMEGFPLRPMPWHRLSMRRLKPCRRIWSSWGLIDMRGSTGRKGGGTAVQGLLPSVGVALTDMPIWVVPSSLLWRLDPIRS